MRPCNYIALSAVLALSGCSLLKPDRGDVLAEYVPDSFSQPGGQQLTQGPWWTDFNAPELNRLMDEAFSGNLTIAQYAARLRQQQALAVKAGAGRIPAFSGTGTAGTTWPDLGKDQRIDAYKLGLTASYELDLWGRVQSTAKAAELSREASRHDLQSAVMSLSANIANTWTAIIAQQTKLNLLNNQLEANTQTLELLQLRQRNAISTNLDVLQQKQVLETTRALIPSAELQLALLKSQLNVLLGRMPGAEIEITATVLPELPPLPAAGLPAELLLKRPDIQAGLQRLEARNYAVAAARADRLPTITLTGSLSATDSELENLIDNWAGNLAAGLVAPLIDGGRRRAEVDYQTALADETLAGYRATVLTAITEVNDALATEQKTSERRMVEQQQQRALNEQLSEATMRYRRGLNSYLTVLSALSSKQGLDRNLITTQLEQCKARIELYRALGGDWMAETAETISK